MSATILMHPGPRTPELTPVLTVVERVGVFPLLIGIEGDDLHIRLRTRAADARLRDHAVRLPRAIRPWYRNGVQVADALLVRVTRTSDRIDTTVEARSGGIVKVSMPVRTTHGWTLLSPSLATIAPGTDYRSMAWCFALLIPLGYWTRALHPARRRLGWSLGISAVLSGLVLGPLVFALSLPGWSDVAASGAGLATGALLWRRGRQLAAPATSP